MDDAQALAQLLGNGFFPIVVCAVLFVYVYKQSVMHKQEIDGLKDVLNNVNITLQSLKDTIDGDRKERGKDDV